MVGIFPQINNVSFFFLQKRVALRPSITDNGPCPRWHATQALDTSAYGVRDRICTPCKFDDHNHIFYKCMHQKTPNVFTSKTLDRCRESAPSARVEVPNSPRFSLFESVPANGRNPIHSFIHHACRRVPHRSIPAPCAPTVGSQDRLARGGAAMQSSAVRGTPQWLRGLLSEGFFDACAVHPAERKNDKNHFCADCAAALCRHCLPHDPSHNVLQVHLRVLLGDQMSSPRRTCSDRSCYLV